MRAVSFLFTLLIITSVSFGQAGKKVIIYKYTKKVPEGKVWKLERGKETKVQVSEGTLNSGTFCNAMFLSRPGIVFNINKGDIFNAESFGIIMKSFEKVPYTNDITYSIIPTSFIDKDFELSELRTNKPEDVGTKELVFKAGETVFVANCLESIELTEYDMSKEDLAIENKKKQATAKERERLKANFNIPVNPEKYVEPGTKPELHDKSLTRIVFSSDAVLHRQPGKRFAVDDVSVWTMTLTIDNFDLSSNKGIKKSYKVLDISYDEALKMQAFKLGDDNGKPTHTLNISWSKASNNYSVLLTAIDRSEEYQFQDTQATSKL
jgi:hypothetical protein